jgi:Asp-tRNA(Asn)/Glu-tRNA(Gln) amidotransferase A subunit family amidase
MNYIIKSIGLILVLTILGCDTPKEVKKINLSELTISDIHSAYKDDRYNSEELVLAYIKQIEIFDDSINSISIINPEALAIAKKLDADYRNTGILKPLHGIPLIVKDNINTKGLPTTGGSLALKDFIPEENAFIINKLIDAGAIIIAKSNMAEWAFSAKHTESSTKGTTRNPYNLAYVPAGSSGGTAASVASNFGTIGLGTDTGNSIRGPSSRTALVGFRTTLGLISREGIIPLILRNDVVGPMCRTVQDATKVMEVMVGYDTNDEITKHSKGKIPENYTQFLQKDGLKGARIGVLRELIDEDSDQEIIALFDAAINDMKALGAQIIDSVKIPDFATLKQNQWCAEFRKDVEYYLASYVKNDSVKTLEDIIAIGSKSEYATGRLQYFATHEGRFEDKDIKCLDPFTDVKQIAFREAIEKRMDELQLDAIIYPTWNNKPAKIELFNEEYLGDNSQIIAPHTGQPAFTVPMGFTAGNLPAGIQFLGRLFDEPILIKLVYAYEQGTAHRKPPILK